jgi:phage terminase large subunit-like protein
MSTLDAFEKFVNLALTTERGDALALEPFQREALTEHFEGVRETLLLLPKKSGKSTILAGRGLYELITVSHAEIAVVASSRDQAAILLKQAHGFIDRSPELRRRLTAVRREIRHRTNGGTMRILAADSDTLDGWIGSLALTDEIGRWRSGENYNLLRAGVVPRDGQIIGISTASDDEANPLGKVRAAAQALPSYRRAADNDRHKIATSPGFAMHEWSMDPGDDHEDIDLIKQVNPASWQTRELLQEELDSPSFTPWQHKRFRCGLWTAGEDGAISEKEWNACASPGCEIEAGADDVFVGIDLGWKWDTSAMVPIRRYGGKVRIHTPTILTPPQDGSSLDAEEMFGSVVAIRKRWPTCRIILDPEAGGEQLAQRIDLDLGGEVIVHSQKAGPMCQASQILSESIAARQLEHPDDDALNRHVLAAGAKFHGVGWRLVKQRGKSLPIDASIALAMALRVMAEVGSTESNNHSNVKVADSSATFT